MALRSQREGIDAGFHMLPGASYEGTLGDPERILWASIRHMCARDVAEEIVFGIHKVKKKSDIQKISRNIKVYIDQAYSFYNAAQAAETNTAPLIFYYSYLNLAKALSEIRYPGFHEHTENYNHGITWKPSKDYLVNVSTESINISTRGVWHTLLETVTGQSVRVPNPLSIKVKDLFALCPETGIEFERTFHQPVRLIELIEAGIFVDDIQKELWLRLTVNKSNLKSLKLTRPKFIKLFTATGFKYEQVCSDDDSQWIFESTPGIKFKADDRDIPYDFVEPLITPMNLFAHMHFDELGYMIPYQNKLPIKLPQLMVLYSLIFWLGSLVRYDPHSVDALRDSRNWILIDGFMNQSRIWLLELFEWHLYRTDTTLRSVR